MQNIDAAHALLNIAKKIATCDSIQKMQVSSGKNNKRADNSNMEQRRMKMSHIEGMDPKKDYAQLEKEVQASVVLLQNNLKKHAAEFKRRPEDWSLVGDLQHVREKLNELHTFLGIIP